MSMMILPEELWTRILEIGVMEKRCLNCKDLCSLSITCTALNTLVSSHHSLWSFLLFSDFPPPPLPPPPTVSNTPTCTSSSSSQTGPTSSSSYKALYKIRYERDREQKCLAHRRLVLRIESEIAESSRKIREMELHSAEEREKIRTAVAELLNLRRVRQASVALNVWQPEIIRGKQKQMVEQCDVPVESRISALEMEFRLCKQQITNYDNALKVENRKVDRAKEKLESVKYHPLHDVTRKRNRSDEHSIRRKKSKHV